MMPYKDGFTLAKEIREKNETVPLIFLTAKTMKEDVLKGFKIGADDYLSKPFDSEVLLAKIKSILGRRVVPATTESDEMEFVIGKFNLNAKLRLLTFQNYEPVKLSPKENQLLRLLALHINDLYRMKKHQTKFGGMTTVLPHVPWMFTLQSSANTSNKTRK